VSDPWLVTYGQPGYLQRRIRFLASIAVARDSVWSSRFPILQCFDLAVVELNDASSVGVLQSKERLTGTTIWSRYYLALSSSSAFRRRSNTKTRRRIPPSMSLAKFSFAINPRPLIPVATVDCTIGNPVTAYLRRQWCNPNVSVSWKCIGGSIYGMCPQMVAHISCALSQISGRLPAKAQTV